MSRLATRQVAPLVLVRGIDLLRPDYDRAIAAEIGGEDPALRHEINSYPRRLEHRLVGLGSGEVRRIYVSDARLTHRENGGGRRWRARSERDFDHEGVFVPALGACVERGARSDQAGKVGGHRAANDIRAALAPAAEGDGHSGRSEIQCCGTTRNVIGDLGVELPLVLDQVDGELAGDQPTFPEWRRIPQLPGRLCRRRQRGATPRQQAEDYGEQRDEPSTS